jgi:translation initiation factor IF-2
MIKETTRAPIVCVLGHVDHGKTTLLDAIRKTSVAARESGGITQSIGASEVTTKDSKKITFIDTPGHAAFSKMRSRGANVADIAILAVASEDGIKPQTQEALDLIKKAAIPFIVAATKTDLPSADPEMVRSQLENQGVSFEGRGGEVPFVAVSGKTGKGVEELLSTISLLSEVKEIKASPDALLEAVVIETQKDKRGSLVSVIVREGQIKVGDMIYAEGVGTKVRGLFNDKAESIKVVYPGDPVQILGFETLPSVGSGIKSDRGSSGGSIAEAKVKKFSYRLQKDQIPVIIKAKNAGALEAVTMNLPKEIVVVDSGIGDVFESDVLLAKSSNAERILAFESKASPTISKLADAEGVRIESFKIIYELFQRVEEILHKGDVDILGKAEVIASFPYNDKKIAGCRVVSGKITKTDSLILQRDEKEIGKAKAISLKKQKQEVGEAKAGEEFGVLFEPQLDFQTGDMVVSVAHQTGKSS